MAIRVAINGFGRIGRAFFRVAQTRTDMEVVAINDLGDINNLAYLLKYDSVYGRAPFYISVAGGSLVVNEKAIEVFSEKDPTHLPWRDHNIDVVVESTGLFTDYDKANVHIVSGAKRVVITAPVKTDSDIGATVLMGLNEDRLISNKITSNASCTTNAASPIISILDKELGIDRALLTTTHAYTASQSIVDGYSKKDWKEGRAAAQNIIPTSTGAAVAVTKAYPTLVNRFDGISLRVPVPAGSITDVTLIAKRDTTAEEVNEILRKAARDPHWEGIFTATDEDLVSSDIIGDPHAAIAALPMTRAIGNLVKVLTWYDNEIGYCHMLARHVAASGALAHAA